MSASKFQPIPAGTPIAAPTAVQSFQRRQIFPRAPVTIGYQSPADVLDGFQDNDEEVVERATGALRKRAGARRGPGGTVDTALRPGTKVRLVNLAYMKASMRGNTLKTIPRWSERIYSIRRRRGGGASPYEYQLEGRPKKDWFARELLTHWRISKCRRGPWPQHSKNQGRLTTRNHVEQVYKNVAWIQTDGYL